MRGNRSRYKYNDGRDSFTFEDGRSMGYFKLYTIEVEHLAAARLSGGAILLYLFIGARCSGNREGFAIGGQQIQRSLGMSRSTIYAALRSLKQAGLVNHRDEDGRTIYSLANVDGSGRPMDRPKDVRNTGQQSSEISDKEQDNSDCLPTVEDKFNSPLAPLDEEVSTEEEKDAGHGGRRLTVPFDLVAEVWAELYRCAKETREGEAVFDRALEGDNSLVQGFIEFFKADPRWSFKHRRRWFAAALAEAGRWGMECDVDHVNASHLAVVEEVAAAHQAEITADELAYLARHSTGEDN